MGLLKTAILGAAVYAAVKYITKKDVITGKSIVDDLSDQAPEWIDKAKAFGQDIKNRAATAEERFSE
ncbi:YtxH domain-containing protein [Pedobacter jamesrossensis]|uniref:YtxH domain-containing protein n=1 Tax=Pedobacter jamesrossensis TaxID=1908238 RepID=A0ABV8NP54_9SPHI